MGRVTETTGQLPVSTYQDPFLQFSQVTLQTKFYKLRVTDFSRLTAIRKNDKKEVYKRRINSLSAG